MWRGTVVGDEAVTVGSHDVRTEHVRIDLDDGSTRDQQRYECWYRWGGDLLVRQTAEMATVNTSSIGDVHYREQYTMSLVSLGPRR